MVFRVNWVLESPIIPWEPLRQQHYESNCIRPFCHFNVFLLGGGRSTAPEHSMDRKRGQQSFFGMLWRFVRHDPKFGQTGKIRISIYPCLCQCPGLRPRPEYDNHRGLCQQQWPSAYAEQKQQIGNGTVFSKIFEGGRILLHQQQERGLQYQRRADKGYLGRIFGPGTLWESCPRPTVFRRFQYRYIP